MAAVQPRPRLVHQTANGLRELVFAHEKGERLGSLPELATTLGVGIVTVQQAARILEHEGLLIVRRGPSGGYYGARPDEASLERLIGAYIREHPTSYEEALDITSVLFNELVAAAAKSIDEASRGELEILLQRVDNCQDEVAISSFEGSFQEQLFAMVRRPLFEILTRVTLRLADKFPRELSSLGKDGGSLWRAGRRRIITAILDGDEELARFEADRSNRKIVLETVTRLREVGLRADS